MKKSILFVLITICFLLVHSQVHEVEYFFDNDPGYGNAMQVTSQPNGDAWTFNADISHLSDGFHTLYIRAKGESGWSQVMSRPFVKTVLPIDLVDNVSVVEYFIDRDPGYGNAMQVTSQPNGDAWTFNADISHLSDGFHTLYIRTKEESGWSQVMSRPFVKTVLPADAASELQFAEYYLDSDPGQGNGIVIPFSPYDNLLDFHVDLASVVQGPHTLKVRGFNNFNQWFLIGEHPFTINNTLVAEHNTESVSLYPNPVQNTLHIQSSSIVEQLTVYDISGRVLRQIVKPSKEIDVNGLAKGIYFVKVKTVEGETVRKVVKN